MRVQRRLFPLLCTVLLLAALLTPAAAARRFSMRSEEHTLNSSHWW